MGRLDYILPSTGLGLFLVIPQGSRTWQNQHHSQNNYLIVVKLWDWRIDPQCHPCSCTYSMMEISQTTNITLKFHFHFQLYEFHKGKKVAPDFNCNETVGLKNWSPESPLNAEPTQWQKRHKQRKLGFNFSFTSSLSNFVKARLCFSSRLTPWWIFCLVCFII